MKTLLIILLLYGCASVNHTQPKGHAATCIDMKQKQPKQKQPKKKHRKIEIIPLTVLTAVLFVLAYNATR